MKTQAALSISKVRRGVVLVVVIVAIAVMAVLATVISASLSSGVDRIVLAADILFRFKTEIIGPDPSFYERVRIYPGSLSHLVYPITTSQRNSCQQFYRASPDVTIWKGPYHLIPWVPGDLYVLALGITAQDATVMTSFTNGAPALAIVMNDIQVADAKALKAKIDGESGDTIKFTPDVNNPDNPVIVHYRMPAAFSC